MTREKEPVFDPLKMLVVIAMLTACAGIVYTVVLQNAIRNLPPIGRAAPGPVNLLPDIPANPPLAQDPEDTP